MTTMIETEGGKRAAAVRRADEYRERLQGVTRQLERVTRTYEIGAALKGSKPGDKLIKLCLLIGELEAIDKGLKGLSPVDRALEHRAAIIMIRDLGADLTRRLIGDPLVGALDVKSGDCYTMARHVLAFTETRPTTRRKTTNRPEAIHGQALQFFVDAHKRRKAKTAATSGKSRRPGDKLGGQRRRKTTAGVS